MNQKVMRYHSLSIALHWMIGLALIFMFASGFFMVNADMSKADQYRLFQIHKASGVLVLLAIGLCLLVRLVVSKPALPSNINKTEQKYASLERPGEMLNFDVNW